MNGNLAIAKGEPVYRVYIFSKYNNKWICMKSIELIKYHQCFILPKGKLFILLDIPFVMLQWDLATLKIEAKYNIDLNLRENCDEIKLDLNNNNTLLTITGRATCEDRTIKYSYANTVTIRPEKLTVYVYSTKLCTMIKKCEYLYVMVTFQFLSICINFI